MPVVGERFNNRSVIASKPPAEAPMATIVNGLSNSLGGLVFLAFIDFGSSKSVGFIFILIYITKTTTNTFYNHKASKCDVNVI